MHSKKAILCTHVSRIGCGIRLIIILAVISSGVTAPSLNSTLVDGQFACVGSDVTFTCVTRGSNIIVWLSDEYVGANDQLVFDAGRNNPGNTRTSAIVAGTLAMLTREYNDRGTTVLESTLRVRINSLLASRNATVSCSDIGQSSAMSFQVIGATVKPEDVVAVQIRRTESNCVVHTLWRRQKNFVSEYQISANGRPMPGVNTAMVNTTNGTKESALLFMQCGAHVIRVRAANACGWGPESPDLTLDERPQHTLLEPQLATSPTEMITTATGEGTVNPNVANRENSTEKVLIGVFVVVVLILLVIIAILAGAVYWLHTKNSRLITSCNRESKTVDVGETKCTSM